MGLIRRVIYRLGFRPKRGTIFYSPSLAWQYYFVDGGDIGEAISKRIREIRTEHGLDFNDVDMGDSMKPCKGQNTNICVAEGCFGESCIRRSK